MRKIINESARVLKTGGRTLPSFVAGLTGAMLCITGALAAGNITSKVDVTPPTKHLSGNEWRSISLSASRVLKHVDQALDALADKKSNVASTNIEKGLTLVKLVHGVLPATTVKTEISGAGLTYSDVDQFQPAFVPIFREYDAVDVVSPITEQKQAVTSSKSAGSRDAAPRTAPEVTYAGADYSAIKLDLRLARRDLLAAQDAIKSGDTPAAQLALRDIQSRGVIFEFSDTRQPLARAMDNLRLAESELKNNHPDKARVALDGAKDALKNYEQLVGNSRAKNVQKMQKEIDDVSKNLPQQKSESFSQKISEWWNKCLEWFK